jgi:hypothetical protein
MLVGRFSDAAANSVNCDLIAAFFITCLPLIHIKPKMIFAKKRTVRPMWQMRGRR